MLLFIIIMIGTKFYSIYSRIGKKLIHGIELQLFLFFISLPILIAWGLPISLMSCIGNIVFAPFLSIFLLLCCAIFFLELFSLPNYYVITCLDYFTQFWQAGMKIAQRFWLIGFAKPPLYILIGIAGLGLLVLHLKTSRLYKIIYFSISLLIILLLLKLNTSPTMQIKKIACGKAEIIALQSNKELILINPAIPLKSNIQNWIEYTLLRELNQQFGTTTIDHVIITNPSILTFEYCSQLCKLTKVKKIYLPLWQGQNDPTLLKKYGAIRYHLNKNNSTLLRLGNQPYSILLGDASLTINPLTNLLCYKNIQYPALSISLEKLNCQPIILYPS